MGLPERDVDREVVQAQGLLGVLLELLRFGAVVVGQVRVEPVEVLPVDVQGLLVVGVLLCELTDLVAVVIAVELLEAVDEFGVLGGRHLSGQWLCPIA